MLSLLEVLVHINPARILAYRLISIEVPDSLRVYQADDLPAGWRATGTTQPLPSQTFLLDWLREPDSLLVQVSSGIVPIVANCLINSRHELFSACRVIHSAPFEIGDWLYDPARRS